MPEHMIFKMFREKNYPAIMGILNVTPDSFSDGNKYFHYEGALARAKELISQGADIIDIGGESSRPGSKEINVEEEVNRVIPIVDGIRQFSNIPISIDTRKSHVADRAIRAGANLINDISALRYDPDMISLLSENPNVGVILMHMQGEPTNMQLSPQYDDILYEICSFFEQQMDLCLSRGILRDRIIIDPGIGFGKNLEHNLCILSNLKTFQTLSVPILLGASRKSFINDILHSTPINRIAGSLAAAYEAYKTGVNIIRVHDVMEHVQFFEVLMCINDRHSE